ncbi:MAG: hypothetical protein LBL81_04660 [Tannerella sp.]|jgi:hypothetical protein|nr:hypothetical protein [Tannerella sp.]
MDNQARIQDLLADLKALDQLLSGIAPQEVYPVAFFSRCFDLAHRLLRGLQTLEGEQIEALHGQMEAYRQAIDTLLSPQPVAAPLAPQAAVQAEVPQEEEPLAGPAVEAPQAEEIPEASASTEEKKVEAPRSLNDVLGRKSLSDRWKATSLNDRFSHKA